MVPTAQVVVAVAARLAAEKAPLPAAAREAREGEGGPEELQATDTELKAAAGPPGRQAVAERPGQTVRARVLARHQPRGVEGVPGVVSPVDHHVRRRDPVRGAVSGLGPVDAGGVARA